MNIGVFDSGIGGLSLYIPLLKLAKGEVYYYADSENMPYGEKSPEWVIERVSKICQYFYEKNVQCILIACHTATAIAIDEMRERFPQIFFVGVEPYVTLKHLKINVQKPLLLATPLTVASKRFQQLIEKYDQQRRICVVSCPGLANTIETFGPHRSDKIIPVLENILAPYRQSEMEKFPFDICILGCTHYFLVSSLIEKCLGIETVAPIDAILNRIPASYLEEAGNKNSRYLQSARIKI